MSSRTDEITLDDLREKFYYSEDSPSGLKFKKDVLSGRNYSVVKAFKGDNAGYRNSSLGWIARVKRVCMVVPRIIISLHQNELIPKTQVVDHLDGDRSNNKIENLRLVDTKTNCRNRTISKNNTTGTQGICIVNIRGYLYAQSKWCDIDGVVKRKYFSVLKHGVENALVFAKEHRASMMTRLNTLGAGYTERHLNGG